MSRFCGDVDSTPILEAAAHWRDAALVSGRSVFTNEALWTVESLAALDKYFVQRPDESTAKFLSKLEQQLAPADAAAKQLAAEMLWLMYLCPSNMSPRHKRQTVQTIWAWSGAPFPAASPWLADKVLTGIGSGGPGFNQNQWRELVFLINLAKRFRAISNEEQQRVLSDGWAFGQWLKQVPDWEARQLRHMVLFLLFPDDFERIFGQNDRRAVVGHFSQRDRRAVNRMDAVQIDHELRSIRTRLESEQNTNELDFYEPPLRDQWRGETFASATDGVTVDHVRSALHEIDRDGVPSDAESTFYDLVHGGKRYPPKLVLSLAVRYATGEPLDRGTFSGGEESSAFRLLRRLGFEITAKSEASGEIARLLQRFLEQAAEGTQLGVQDYLGTYRNLRVKVSFGKGNVARIPWIAFLGDGQSVSHGIYPVLLLFREQQQLLLCFGVSEENQATTSWGALGAAATVRDWFRAKYGRNPDRYGASFVAAAYDINDELPIASLQAELDKIIDRYMAVLSSTPLDPDPPDDEVEGRAKPLTMRADLGEAVRSFAVALREAGVHFGDRHETLTAAFVASLATKPLVILTGLSGSGKTQIAVRFGEWLGAGRLHVAAVRPDWTGAEALFGYEDGLKPSVGGRPAWSVPAPLEFMLKAAGDPQHPYLLLLDEMNLAHVERYFADVLSGMESGQPCLPNLEQGTDGSWRRRDGLASVAFPRNLWIVGTVNVDETTYMFSPKVLDRANTFEFRVETGDLSDVSRKPRPCASGDAELIRGLLSIARDDEWHLNRPAGFRTDLMSQLRQLHDLLSRYNLEFGHRFYYEALRFAAMAQEAGLGEQDAVLDRIIMQKVLPRLHGSRRRLEPPLLALAHYCRDLPDSIAADEKLPTLGVDSLTDKGARLKTSHSKVVRMLRSLRANQFASFTE